MKLILLNWKYLLSSIFAIFLCSSCASIDSQEILNHPAMEMNSYLEALPPSSMTNLTDFSSFSGGGGCSTCAH